MTETCPHCGKPTTDRTVVGGWTIWGCAAYYLQQLARLTVA